MKKLLNLILMISAIIAMITITITSIISIPDTINDINQYKLLKEENKLLNEIKILNKDVGELTQYSEILNNTIRMQEMIVKINNMKIYKNLDDQTKYLIKLQMIATMLYERKFNESIEKNDPKE
jgi:predicted PurR-regulated permease PerM